MQTSQLKVAGHGSICISRCTVEGVSNHLLGVCEGIYQLDFFYKVTSNTPHLLTKVVFCEGVITWQPEADILVAWRKPVHAWNDITVSKGKLTPCANIAP